MEDGNSIFVRVLIMKALEPAVEPLVFPEFWN
jgi:hypothetical protein